MGIHFFVAPEKREFKFNLVEGKPFFLFFEEYRKVGQACGGQRVLLSDPAGRLFKNCAESSKISNDFSCISGLSRKHVDEAGSSWHTSTGNGVGQYIEIKFTEPVQIEELRFQPRDDLTMSPTEIIVHPGADASDAGEQQKIALKSSNSMRDHTYDLQPVITKSVRIEISRMNVNGRDSGGSFEVWGTKCGANKQEEEEEPILLGCDQTLQSLPEAHPKQVGWSFPMRCPLRCLRSPAGPVFGKRLFALESSICTASLAAGACSQKDSTEDCDVRVTMVPGDSVYEGGVVNGINVETHSATSLAFELQSLSAQKVEARPFNAKIMFGSPPHEIPEGAIIEEGTPIASKENHGKAGLVYGFDMPAQPSDCNESIRFGALLMSYRWTINAQCKSIHPGWNYVRAEPGKPLLQRT
eukprot:Selendium_serpulae@DN9297_c0_g1_i1.p1